MSAFWTRGRNANAESGDAAVPGVRARIWRLTAVDRCDRCGAQAYVRVLLPGRLELLFCAHHNRQYSSALADIAVEIQDETMRLACCALSGRNWVRYSELNECDNHAAEGIQGCPSVSIASAVKKPRPSLAAAESRYVPHICGMPSSNRQIPDRCHPDFVLVRFPTSDRVKRD